jgi:hypothetical protein
MKTLACRAHSLFLPILLALSLPSGAGAADSQSGDVAAAKLPYGTADVLKLSQAQINEEVILNYVRNSGTAYTLSANDVVYLRNQGVSDRVVNAMLEQRPRVEPSAAASAAPQIPSSATVAQGAVAPTYVEPAVVAPPPPPASTVHVISSPAVRRAYYGTYSPYYYPYRYYGPYYTPYYRPSVVVGLRFGGPAYHHGYWGCR